MRSIVASEFADLFSKFKKLTEFAESASSAINNHVQTIAIAVDRGIKQAAWIEVASEDSWLFKLLNRFVELFLLILPDFWDRRKSLTNSSFFSANKR